jgi:hypothetical protein
MRTLEQEFNSLQAQREACEAANEVRGGGAVGGQPDFLNALARCNDFCTGLKRQRRNDYSASRPSIPDAESQPLRQPKADSNPLPGCVAPHHASDQQLRLGTCILVGNARRHQRKRPGR